MPATICVGTVRPTVSVGAGACLGENFATTRLRSVLSMFLSDSSVSLITCEPGGRLKTAS